MAVVRLSKVEKTYPNGFKAVHGVDLEVRDGEFMVFVGPSGCAKSTLLRMVAGLESITAGELRIGDRAVNDLPPKARGIAMGFQNYALYPHMTVYENLAFGLRLSKTPKAELDQRVRHAAKLLEMEHLLERYPKQLSGGQAQRVAVGRAIVKKPEVFLFDEPLSNLDAKLRAAMRVRLTELHRSLRDAGQPATTIYVTHDQVEAMTMGERICVLKAGVIQQVDTPTALYGPPRERLRRQLHRLAGDEHRQGARRQRRGAAWRSFAAAAAGRFQPVNGEVQFGLRPEHITLQAGAASIEVQGVLRFCEHMGAEVFVYFDVGSQAFSARISAELGGQLATQPRGSVLSLHFQMQHVHLFAPDEVGLSLLA